MKKVSVTNTAIIINDYHKGDCQKIEWYFNKFDKIYHKAYDWGMFLDEENNKLYIPIGFGLDKVLYYLHCSNSMVEYLPPTDYKLFNKTKMKYGPRDETQIEALKFMCGLDNYKYTQDMPNLSINLNTGKGKSYCSIASILYFGVKSIIITGSTSLLEQWKNYFFEYTDFKDSDLLNISGSDMISMIMSGKSKKAEEAKVFLCSHGTLRSFASQYGWSQISELFKVLGIGIKIFDEVHTNFQNVLYIDYFTNVVRTYYVTATPGRSSRDENRIFQISIGKVESIDLFDENKDPHTDYVCIKYNSKPSPQVVSAMKNAYGIAIPKYINWVTKNKLFYQMIDIIMDFAMRNAISSGGKVLIYIGTNDGILRVYNYICKSLPQYIGEVGIFTDLVPKNLKRDELNHKIILSTMKSCAAGEDIPGLKMTIVLCEPFASEILARQSLGRCRAEGTVYVEVVDVGFYHLNKFYNKKKPVFDKYALSCTETVIDNYELNARSERIKEERSKNLYCPIRLKDDRFDFDSVLPKWMRDDLPDERGLICPIVVHKEKDYNPYL